MSSHEVPDAPQAHQLEVTPEETAALRLWVIMSRAHAAIAEHAAADVSRHGLTLTEFAIVEALYHRGPLLLGEVQKRILVSSGGITFLVDRLAAKGLVERRSCPSDRRARYAALTPEGEALMAHIFPTHVAALTRAMSALSVEQKDEATRALRALGLRAAELPLASADSTALTPASSETAA
ncbi:MAG: MarR family transcriptional regulator [Gemmatimonadaceae bacterium]|nr:MarR family transcriptional regulator [Gemmatimonadaceae bacterium]